MIFIVSEYFNLCIIDTTLKSLIAILSISVFKFNFSSILIHNYLGESLRLPTPK